MQFKTPVCTDNIWFFYKKYWICTTKIKYNIENDNGVYQALHNPLSMCVHVCVCLSVSFWARSGRKRWCPFLYIISKGLACSHYKSEHSGTVSEPKRWCLTLNHPGRAPWQTFTDGAMSDNRKSQTGPDYRQPQAWSDYRHLQEASHRALRYSHRYCVQADQNGDGASYRASYRASYYAWN